MKLGRLVDEMEKSHGNTGVSGELKFNLFYFLLEKGKGWRV
jgi:hypothetical protein